MTDKEKIIKGLHCMSQRMVNDYDDDELWCESCEYNRDMCMIDIISDVLALLKEQEQKTGHWTTHRTMHHDGEWYCDQCDYEPTVFEGMPYCLSCGAKMEMGKW